MILSSTYLCLRTYSLLHLYNKLRRDYVRYIKKSKKKKLTTHIAQWTLHINEHDLNRENTIFVWFDFTFRFFFFGFTFRFFLGLYFPIIGLFWLYFPIVGLYWLYFPSIGFLALLSDYWSFMALLSDHWSFWLYLWSFWLYWSFKSDIFFV